MDVQDLLQQQVAKELAQVAEPQLVAPLVQLRFVDQGMDGAAVIAPLERMMLAQPDPQYAGGFADLAALRPDAGIIGRRKEETGPCVDGGD